MAPYYWRILNARQCLIIISITSTVGLFVSLRKALFVSKHFLLDEMEDASFSAVTIYVVTPTYKRTSQMADLTRLAQTLMLVPDVHWLLIEDANVSSYHVADLLKRTGLPYSHLCVKTPVKKYPVYKFGKGVRTRLEALKWLRNRNDSNSVIYFADDDNSYDIRVFEEMRSTREVSVWPVGLIESFGISSPIVRNGKVVGFHDPYMNGRTFAMDMAGFAVAGHLFLSRPKATFPYTAGLLEDYFLRGLQITLNDLEPKARNCTLVLAWHTRTRLTPKPDIRNMNMVDHCNDTNIPDLYEDILEEQVGQK